MPLPPLGEWSGAGGEVRGRRTEAKGEDDDGG